MNTQTLNAGHTPARTPIPRATVNVGITGHCRDFGASENALRAHVADVLREIQDNTQRILANERVQDTIAHMYAPGPPRFVLLSSLAFGADCLVAEEALKLGYELHVPLPMAQPEYEKDFDAAGLATFHSLLSRAARVFEIVDSNPERGHAYADASRVVLTHSDILLALWDGKNTEKIAGTAPVVELAANLHIPAVHIHSDAVTPTSIIKDGYRDTEWRQEIQKHLDSLLLPAELFSGDASQLAYFRRFAHSCHAQEPLNVPFFFRLYTAFTNLVLKFPRSYRPGPGIPTLGDDKSFTAGEHRWRDAWKDDYNWFDNISNAYSSIYRSCLVYRYAAPVIAVLALALGLAWHQEGGDSPQNWVIITFFGIQLCFLVIPIILALIDRKRLWHRKFFSYRVVGEHIRQMRHLWAMGFCNTSKKECAYTGGRQRWTAWYRRALTRHRGLPAPWEEAAAAPGTPPRAVVDHDYLVTWLGWTRNLFVTDQLAYHSNRQKKEENICRKLMLLGLGFFCLSIAAAAGRAYMLYDSIEPFLATVGVVAVVLPSLAVFFTGFCSYAGYAKNCQVSSDTCNNLEAIRREIDAILLAESQPCPACSMQPERLHYTRALFIAQQIHDCCGDELLGWEDIISSRNIRSQG